ncbi:uncharacterized protein MYCGRDRAFT_103232 [Zymoseptoria tritici IPO323]|uniref:Uncharacterized protein n=1 Tax=Zymoseptoria tritici (strain CBS 115943 / IPO323) TaxID=336722 RepID=F9X2V2_ZYMTI|nr:uncharacterized protein MYCGRDRAFT_103232 [Zymoseptoria tritici IPO323]EGP90538.1 hypothetical protein MYCGRDRAFT_103232 [Zymoseptoria tritici IPO323]
MVPTTDNELTYIFVGVFFFKPSGPNSETSASSDKPGRTAPRSWKLPRPRANTRLGVIVERSCGLRALPMACDDASAAP